MRAEAFLLPMLLSFGALADCTPAPSVRGGDPVKGDASAAVEDVTPVASLDATASDGGATEPCASHFVRSPDCKHPPVEARCRDGFCEIPPGCFVIGSPECQPLRGARNEDEAQVTLTHRFEIGQHEVTQGEWMAAGFVNGATPPDPDAGVSYGSCALPECPATNLSWFDAVAYANFMSRSHVPSLPECYALEGCTGQPGAGMKCTGIRATGGSVYDCKGYRLPTESEWEYSARAGTRTPYYSGPMVATSVASNKECYERTEPNLDKVAWYCGTATTLLPRTTRTQPVMLKQPNAWGVYDQLGNVSEWTGDEHDGLRFRGGPHVDPGSVLTQGPQRTERGGGASFSAATCTVSFRIGTTWDRITGVGLRLARTLPSR